MSLCQLTRGVADLEGIRYGRRARKRDAATSERGGHMARQDYEEKYTHPELREEIKEEIKASDRGEKDESQKGRKKWTEEEWQTREGDADARQDGETKRYLPKQAWENMSEEEKEETERKKREGSKQGQQYVSNTDGARQARKEAAALPLKGYDDLGVEEVEKQAKGLSKYEIQDLLDYEKQHKNRKTLVEALDRKL